MDSNNMIFCYIRRPGPDGWVQGRTHHKDAFDAFMALPTQNDPIRISVPHLDGGNFVAHFSRVNEHYSEYVDEYGRRVEIMMSTPGYAAYINRIIDHY